MPPEFTPLTEPEPDSWHRRTHPNPVAQALAHTRSSLRFSGRDITIPPPPGREPWNRQHKESPNDSPAARLDQLIAKLLQSHPQEHGMVVTHNANTLLRAYPHLAKLLPDCTICISQQTLSIPNGSRVHFYMPHQFPLAAGLAYAWLIAESSIPDKATRRFTQYVRSRNFTPAFYSLPNGWLVGNFPAYPLPPSGEVPTSKSGA